MDWWGWATFGFVATVVLTVIMVAAQLAGLSRMDLPMMLGTIFVESPDLARVIGFLVHLINGQVFALMYAAAFALMGTATWWLGASFGLIHGLAAPHRDHPAPARHPSTDGLGEERPRSSGHPRAAGSARLELRRTDSGLHGYRARRLRHPPRLVPQALGAGDGRPASSARSGSGPERQRGLDQGGVSESLREIAKVLARCGIHLLREQPEVVRVREEALEDLCGLAHAAQSRQGVDEPERAGEEGPLRPCLALAGRYR